jgi:hypothetical protein
VILFSLWELELIPTKRRDREQSHMKYAELFIAGTDFASFKREVCTKIKDPLLQSL